VLAPDLSYVKTACQREALAYYIKPGHVDI